MRVAVHHLQPARRIVGQLEQPGAHQVTLLLGALSDDHRHRDAFDPLLDHDLRRAGDDVRDDEIRMSLIGFRERALVVCLEPVIQLHLGALDQFVDDALHVGAGGELLEHLDHALHRLQVGAKCLVGARVLDLDRNLATVGPHRLVHLADAGRRHRDVFERRESLAPLRAQLCVQARGAPWRRATAGLPAAAWSARRGRACRTAPGWRPPSPTAPGRPSSRRP